MYQVEGSLISKVHVAAACSHLYSYDIFGETTVQNQSFLVRTPVTIMVNWPVKCTSPRTCLPSIDCLENVGNVTCVCAVYLVMLSSYSVHAFKVIFCLCSYIMHIFSSKANIFVA